MARFRRLLVAFCSVRKISSVLVLLCRAWLRKRLPSHCCTYAIRDVTASVSFFRIDSTQQYDDYDFQALFFFVVVVVVVVVAVVLLLVDKG